MKRLLILILVFVSNVSFAQAQGYDGTLNLGGSGYESTSINLGGDGLDNPPDNAPSYDADAIAIFNAFTTPPTDARKTLINNFVVYLKGTGDWAKIVTCWGMAAETQQAGQINWKSPATFTLTLVNSPTFTADEGFNSNGTTSYINTNWIASTHGAGVYLQDDAGITVYTRTSGTGSGNLFGVIGAANVKSIGFTPKFTDNNLYSRFNNVNTIFYSAANATSEALYTMLRTSSTDLTVYRNSVSLGLQSKTSDGLPTLNLYLLCANNNGTAQLFTTKQASFVIIHSGSISVANLQTAIETYMDGIGKGIIP